jgi:hypothetical protein
MAAAGVLTARRPGLTRFDPIVRASITSTRGLAAGCRTAAAKANSAAPARRTLPRLRIAPPTGCANVRRRAASARGGRARRAARRCGWAPRTPAPAASTKRSFGWPGAAPLDAAPWGAALAIGRLEPMPAGRPRPSPATLGEYLPPMLTGTCEDWAAVRRAPCNRDVIPLSWRSLGVVCYFAPAVSLREYRGPQQKVTPPALLAFLQRPFAAPAARTGSGRGGAGVEVARNEEANAHRFPRVRAVAQRSRAGVARCVSSKEFAVVPVGMSAWRLSAQRDWLGLRRATLTWIGHAVLPIGE